MNIRIIGAATQEDVLNGIYDVDDDDNCETLAEGKRRARYLVTSTEDTFIGYAQVLKDGVCLADYFRK